MPFNENAFMFFVGKNIPIISVFYRQLSIPR